MKNRAILAWSGGKDSALALYEMTRQDRTQVVALLTTVTEGYDRISMHGVRRELLAEQAKALGYPLEEVRLPQQCTNELYEQRTGQALEKYHQSGIARAAFGDLFLEDVRAYREERLSRIGMRGIFPLWGRNTSEVARQFVGLGFRAVVWIPAVRMENFTPLCTLGRYFIGRSGLNAAKKSSAKIAFIIAILWLGSYLGNRASIFGHEFSRKGPKIDKLLSELRVIRCARISLADLVN
ncbi:MAG: hypothetical protein P8X95_13985 [Anaerolineales bacterium]